MKLKKLCMFVTNSVTQDPRVRREAATLAASGYEVVVFGVQQNGHDLAEEQIDGYRVRRVPMPHLMFSNTREAILLGLARVSPKSYCFIRSMYRKAGLSNQTHDELIGEPRTLPPSRVKPLVTLSPPTWHMRLRADVSSIIATLRLNLTFAKHAASECPDVCHAHDLDTLLGAFVASQRTKANLVYDAHELYTEQFHGGVKTLLWYVWYSILERLLTRQADICLTVCDSLGEWLEDKYRIRGVVTIRNVPRFQKPPMAKRDNGQQDRIVLYHGLYFKDRGLEQLISAAPYLHNAKIVLRGYGYLEDHLKALVAARNLQGQVIFAPPVAMIDLVKEAADADIGVGAFLPHALSIKFALPNKLFEYVMAGLAVVGSDLPELRKIITEYNIGKICRPGDPIDLARALNELLDDHVLLESMKLNAKHAARTALNWEIESCKLLQVYEKFGISALPPANVCQPTQGKGVSVMHG